MKKPRDVPAFAGIYENAIRAAQEGRPVLPADEWLANTAERINQYLSTNAFSGEPEIGTTAWYMHRLAWNIDELQAARGRGDMDVAIAVAVALGMLFREAAIQFRHGAGIAAHIDQLATLSAANVARQNKATDLAAEWQAAAERVWKRSPKLLRRRVAEVIAGGHRIDTVRRAIHKPK